MAETTRLRVFERPDGTRFVKQMTESECQLYLVENTDLILVR